MDRDSEHAIVAALAPGGAVARQALGVTAFGLVTGALASIASIAFVDAYRWLNDVLLIAPASREQISDPPLLAAATLTVPAVAGLLVGLCNRFLIPGGRAYGPPHVIREAQSGAGHVGIRGGLASAGAAILSLGGGASVGQYGPLVHLGGTLGSAAGRWLRAGTGLGTIGIGCGVAAAISTAFSAPIAGVLFAHEVVLRHYSLKAFAPITVASALGYFLAEKVFLRDPLFRIEAIPAIGATEFALFVLMGIAGAAVAVSFMNGVLYMGRLASRLHVPDIARPALAGFVLGVIALGAPEVLGMGFETLERALVPGALSAEQLAVILVAKMGAAALCLGFGFAGGVTGPALVIGTLFGALAGHGVLLFTPAESGLVVVYAIVGLAAVTSPVMGAPIATILIVFELTRNYELTTAVMIAVAFSNLVAYRFFGRSMFDVQLLRSGFDLGFGRDKVILDRTPIAPWVTDAYVELGSGVSCRDARAVIVGAAAEDAQVVDAQGRYLGAVDLGRLDAAVDAGEGEVTIESYVVRPAVVLDTRTSIWQAFARAKDFNGHAVPVVGGGGSGRLAGVVPEPVLIRAYLDTVRGIRDEEHAIP